MNYPYLYIIDSGLDLKACYRKCKRINQVFFEFDKIKNIIYFTKNICTYLNNHCNIIFNIILDSSNNNIFVNSIKILDENLSSTIDQMILALKWIYKKKKSGIINLSLGVITENYNDELASIINKLLEKNIYIICSASKVISYPSVLDNVISVSDLNMYKNDRAEIKHKIDFVIDIDSYNYSFIPCSATSFAAPFVTAKAAEILQTKKIDNIFQLKKELCKYFMRWE